MKRVDGQLVPTSWADALNIITEKFSETRSRIHRCYRLAQGTNEENYLLGKLAREVLKTESIGLFGRETGEEHKFPQLPIDADKNPNTRGARDMLKLGDDATLTGDAL